MKVKVKVDLGYGLTEEQEVKLTKQADGDYYGIMKLKLDFDKTKLDEEQVKLVNYLESVDEERRYVNIIYNKELDEISIDEYFELVDWKKI